MSPDEVGAVEITSLIHDVPICALESLLDLCETSPQFPDVHESDPARCGR